MGIIEIEGMEFFACHGHYDVEQKVGNRFLVDILVEYDCSKAAVSDQLDDALDYQKVYLLIKNEMGISSNLLEHVAMRILGALKRQFPEVQKSSVKVSKMNPPMGGLIEKVSVSLNS
ncbi:MAG: dihydroneopterin aldolase [Prolixibacteraceae bacterium]|jgi:dihydroneopterin aldolase|nr:dihydroneopterin aldolase [Prolixibacteraceae bacterium]